MTTRQTRIQWVYVLVLLVACPAWAQEGQADLDQATDALIATGVIDSINIAPPQARVFYGLGGAFSFDL